MKPQKFETIIVGIDFSEYSKVVVKQAINLAKSQQAQLVLVHALNVVNFSQTALSRE